jgi:hypothetical protein
LLPLFPHHIQQYQSIDCVADCAAKRRQHGELHTDCNGWTVIITTEVSAGISKTARLLGYLKNKPLTPLFSLGNSGGSSAAKRRHNGENNTDS